MQYVFYLHICGWIWNTIVELLHRIDFDVPIKSIQFERNNGHDFKSEWIQVFKRNRTKNQKLLRERWQTLTIQMTGWIMFKTLPYGRCWFGLCTSAFRAVFIEFNVMHQATRRQFRWRRQSNLMFVLRIHLIYKSCSQKSAYSMKNDVQRTNWFRVYRSDGRKRGISFTVLWPTGFCAKYGKRDIVYQSLVRILKHIAKNTTSPSIKYIVF